MLAVILSWFCHNIVTVINIGINKTLDDSVILDSVISVKEDSKRVHTNKNMRSGEE